MSSAPSPAPVVGRYLCKDEAFEFFHLVRVLGFPRSVGFAAFALAAKDEAFTRMARVLLLQGLEDPKLSRMMIQHEMKERQPDLPASPIETIEGTPIEEMSEVFERGQDDERSNSGSDSAIIPMACF
jgi:hypothetical protein